MGSGIAQAELLGNQELVQATRHRDPAGDGRAGVAAPIENSDVVPDLLQADFVQAEAVLIQPGEIAVEIVSIGGNGARRGPKLRCQGIKPELGQPLIGPHEILPIGSSMARHQLLTSCQNPAAATSRDRNARLASIQYDWLHTVRDFSLFGYSDFGVAVWLEVLTRRSFFRQQRLTEGWQWHHLNVVL